VVPSQLIELGRQALTDVRISPAERSRTVSPPQLSATGPLAVRQTSIWSCPGFVEVGGLLSYGADQRDEFRLAATYAESNGPRVCENPENSKTRRIMFL
jgi:hypothetical protein